ncbi:hypothetical protein CNR27_10585 [Luteimonas chenhongjianii]|uniref:Uncharacterized protein n=1 Tax=Luteimonas chenhongjianii TaxID=2006110 RepID=A0A290XFM3_9GAMM|nr:hypothetical protein CNR27_10585 [Luteimonas chenhongjianii]
MATSAPDHHTERPLRMRNVRARIGGQQREVGASADGHGAERLGRTGGPGRVARAGDQPFVGRQAGLTHQAHFAMDREAGHVEELRIGAEHIGRVVIARHVAVHFHQARHHTRPAPSISVASAGTSTLSTASNAVILPSSTRTVWHCSRTSRSIGSTSTPMKATGGAPRGAYAFACNLAHASSAATHARHACRVTTAASRASRR